MSIDVASSGAETGPAPAGRDDDRTSWLEVLDGYCTGPPTAQNAVDLFAGDWSSVLPERVGADTGGFAGLFADGRIDWMVERLGGVAGLRILELGPLEGGHTYRLETEHDAAEIVAVEANRRAYLKCLVAKELLGTARSRFLLGDFNRYMAEAGPHFDLVVACGVLYHMENPAEHIKLLCGTADAVFVWTHYYDRQLIEAAGAHVAEKFGVETEVDYEGHRHVLYRQDYLDALGWGGFCGAGNRYSNWLRLDDIYRLFDRYGFDITDTAFDQPTHQNGPAIAFLARRRTPIAAPPPTG